MATNQQTRTILRTDRVRMMREGRGWSQRELGRRCGMGDSQVNKYEAGLADPSVKHLKALAEALEVSADYLLGMTDDPRGQFSDTLQAEERQLLEALAAGDGPAVLTLAADMLRRQENRLGLKPPG